jgi:hypothetical protein
MRLQRSAAQVMAATCLASGCVFPFASDAKPPEPAEEPAAPDDVQPTGGATRRFTEQFPLS